MKVLLIATVQSHICQFHRPLVKMLHDHGCEVHVAARNNLAEKNGLKLDFVDKIYDVPFQRSPFSPKNLRAYRILCTIIQQGSYNVVHCNTPVGGVLGRLATRRARKNGTQVFYTAHGFHFYEGAPKKNWLIWYPIEKYMCRYTDELITIAEEDYQLAKLNMRVSVSHIHGVGANSGKYYPVGDLEQYSIKNKLGFQNNQQLIVCTGELNENKNQITAIRAMKEVVKELPEAILLLAGNGPVCDLLQATIDAYDLQNHVQILGYRTDLEKYVQASDLVLSCSKREGLPMNIIEGMLCKKPIVASINRGHKELIKEGVNGYLVKSLEAGDFSVRIISILKDSIQGKKLGEQGYLMAQPYTDHAVQMELQQIYEKRNVI